MTQIIGEFVVILAATNMYHWFRRTIEDKYTGKNLLLNDQELDIIQKIQQREFPDASVDHYPVRLQFCTSRHFGVSLFNIH